MKRRKFILCLMGTTAAGWAGWKAGMLKRSPQSGMSAAGSGLLKVARSGRAMGTDIRLTVFHEDAAAAESALADAFAGIERVEQVMSLYRPDSQICQLNRTGVLERPDSYFLEVLRMAQRVSEQSGGVFDITVQPLWTAYEAAAQQGTYPDGNALAAALSKVDWRRVEVSDERVRLLGAGTAITLNGIAQGFAADVVARTLQGHGIRHALIDTGEIGTLGNNPGKDNWTIGIKHPRQPGEFFELAALRGLCLATSGDYETRFGEGYNHHHLIDPKSGRSPLELASVSVAAPTALQADALSTAVFLLGLEKGRALVQSVPGTEALFMTKSGRVEWTKDFPVKG